MSVGRFDEAAEKIQVAADTLRRLGLQNTLDYARTFVLTGVAEEARGRNEAALERRLLPPSHPTIAIRLDCIAQCHTSMGDAAAARSARAEAKRIIRRSQAHCSGPGCERKLTENGEPLTVCSGCNATHYCSEECQRRD